MEMFTFWFEDITSSFSKNTTIILRKYKPTDFAVNYIDDILIFFKIFSDHIKYQTRL